MNFDRDWFYYLELLHVDKVLRSKMILYIFNTWTPKFVMIWEYIKCFFFFFDTEYIKCLISPVTCQLNYLFNHLFNILYTLFEYFTVLSFNYVS